MDKVLKRRLIGASILIALAVIFVPMLLVDPDSVESGASGDVDVPQIPDSAREVRRIPLDPQTARVAESDRRSSQREAPAEDDDRAAGEPDAPESRRAAPDDEIVLRPDLAADDSTAQPDDAQDEPGPAPETGPAPAETRQADEAGQPGEELVEDAPGDWIVQVASFSSRDSAGQVRSRLETLGHAVRSDEIVRGQSMLHRLRTGPYRSREAAEQALEQIAATVDGVEPIVREIDEELREGTEPGFVVQVGSFVGEDNAIAETRRLDELGFESFRYGEQVGDREIWRVVVGPVDQRAQADELKSRLAERAGVEGLVVSYP